MSDPWTNVKLSPFNRHTFEITKQTPHWLNLSTPTRSLFHYHPFVLTDIFIMGRICSDWKVKIRQHNTIVPAVYASFLHARTHDRILIIWTENRNNSHYWKQKQFSLLKTETILITENRNNSRYWKQKQFSLLKTETILVTENRNNSVTENRNNSQYTIISHFKK